MNPLQLITSDFLHTVSDVRRSLRAVGNSADRSRSSCADLDEDFMEKKHSYMYVGANMVTGKYI